MGCNRSSSTDIFSKHRRQRIYINPRSNELILCLDRQASGYVIGFTDIELRITQFHCNPKGLPVGLRPYALDSDNCLHFDLAGSEFLSDVESYPHTMYVGQLIIDGCVIDSIEVVKNHSVFIKQTIGIADRCSENTGYVDKSCEECGNDVEDESIPGCYGVKRRKITLRDNLKKEYEADIGGLYDDVYE